MRRIVKYASFNTTMISHGNPLTYQVDALRSIMLAGQTSTYGIGLDFAILLLATTVLVAICARLYPKVVI